MKMEACSHSSMDVSLQLNQLEQWLEFNSLDVPDVDPSDVPDVDHVKKPKLSDDRQKSILRFNVHDLVWYIGDDNVWLNTMSREYRMSSALKAFENDKAPVLERLDEMIEWFMHFFAHKKVEKWQLSEEEEMFWVGYFTMVKYLAIGFGKDQAYFEDFSTDCNPYLIDL